MKSLKLTDSNLFIGEGGMNRLRVSRFKGVHSPRVSEDDWELVDEVSVNRNSYYTSIEILDRVIQHRDLQKLIFDLESSQLLINREGYCYLRCEIQPSSSSGRTLTSHFNNIYFYRLNDLFMWSAYQVNSMYTFNWNRHDIYTNEVIIDTNTSKLKIDYETRIRILEAEKNKKFNQNSQGDSMNEIRLQDKLDKAKFDLQCMTEENKKLQNLVAENKKKTDDAKSNLQCLTEDNKKLQDLVAENKKKSQGFEDRNKNLVNEINNLKGLQDMNEKKLQDLEKENKILKENEKKMQNLQPNVLQRKLDDNSHSPMSSQPPPPPPPPPLKGRYSFQTDEYTSILRYFRPSKPDQFLFEIQCFTELKQSIQDAKCDNFESPEFEVAGQKWMLSIYLEGIPTEDTDDHISLYLKKKPDQSGRVDGMKMLVRFFIYSHRFKEYLTIQELIVQNFDDQFDLEAGIPQALKITDFNDIKNGFVYGGKCRFGIEVFNMQSHPQTFTLTSVKKLYRGGKCICKFNNFSRLPQDAPSYSSDEFKIEIVSVKNRTVTYLWKVQIYPTGIEEDEDKNVSVFLELVSTEKVSSGRQLFADFELRLKCHDLSTKYYPKRRVAWFTQSEYNHGFDDFIPINEFSTNGKYINQDSITVEVYFHKMFRMEDV